MLGQLCQDAAVGQLALTSVHWKPVFLKASMQVCFSRRRLRQRLLLVWLLLTLAGLAVELAKSASGRTLKHELIYFLGLSYEQNLPTWYSSSLLLLCAVSLTLIATAKFAAGLPYRWHWAVLAALFAYVSLDEAVTLHESLSKYFDYGGVLYFGWVIPASIAVLILGLAYLKFLFHLPVRTRNQFIIAGTLYVGGALGVEFLLGYWTDLAGDRNLVYGLIDLIEESLEILGMTLFLCALLEYLADGEEPCTMTFR